MEVIKEIHVVFINRGRTPEDQPVVKPLAATPHDQESKPTRIFVPKARKGDPLSKPDGSLTNVCRTEEAFTTFLPPQSTESTFKPIPMSESRKPKHKKPPTITTDSFEDPSGSLPDEYSAEQVSQKVFDFLEIDQPERDDTIDSRASPIPCDRIIDRDSPRFEYYEEIEFKKPVQFGQSRRIEKHELYETDDLPEAEPEYKEYLDGKKMVIEEVEQPGRTRTHRYLIKGVDPKQVKEYKYVRIPTESKEPFDDGTFDQPTTVRIREGTRTVVRTIRRRIIRKVVIINGVEKVTEEVVEEPVEETVSEFDQPEIEEIEDDERQGKEPKRLEYIKVDKKSESVTPDDELERRIRTSILRPDAKEFTPGSTFTTTGVTPSQKTTFVVRETVQPLAQTPKTQEFKKEDTPTDRVPKEEEPKSVKPQRKKRKKRRGETDQEGTDQIEDNFASEDGEEEFEETCEPEKKPEDAKKPEKLSFFHALVFGKKEKTPEETKSKDDKSKPKKTKETSLPDKIKEDKTTERETEKPKQVEPTKDVKPKDSIREEPSKAPTSEVKKAETKEQAPKADSKKYADTLSFLEFEKSKFEEQKPKEDKSPEDKTTVVDTRKQPEQKGKDKKGKPVEEKEEPTVVKTTEIIRQPSKEDLKKKDRKTTLQDDKTKPVEVFQSTPKTIVTETVELLKQEKIPADKEKVILTEDPTKRSTPEKDRSRPTGERITEEKFLKGVEHVEDKPKVTKKGKTPEPDKPKEELKATDKDKKPKEPTKVEKPAVEKSKFEKEDVKKKKDKTEKSLEEDKIKPSVTAEERKSSQDERPKLTDKTPATVKAEGKELPEEAIKKSTKKGKPSDKEEPKLADQVTQITKFIEGESRLEEPSKEKPDKKQKPQKEKEPETVLVEKLTKITDSKDGSTEKLKPVQKEEPTKKPVEATSEKPKDKKPDDEVTRFEPEEPKEQKKGKSPEDELSKKDNKEDKKPKDEPKKKGKSPEQEEPTKKDVKPAVEDKKPKDRVTVVEEIKFQAEEPKKKEKSPEQKEPTKKDVKSAEDKKPKEKVTVIEEFKLQAEEPKKKGKSPDKEEKPKDRITISEVTKFIETEKPLEDEKKSTDVDKKPTGKQTVIEEARFEPGKPKEQKKEKTPEQEPTRKDDKPGEDAKKPKEKRSFFEIITKPFTKGQSPTDDKSVDSNKQAKDIPKEPEKPSKKDNKPTAEDKTPKDIVVEEVKLLPDEPKKKEISPEQKEPTKKDVKPAEDKKPKDKVTVNEEFKFQPGKPKEVEEPKKKGKSPEQEEPTKKDVKPIVEDKKPKDRVTVVEEIKFQAEEPKKKGKSPDKEEKPKGRITVTDVTKFIETEKPLEDERAPKDKRTVTKVTEIVELKKDEKPVDDEKKPKDRVTVVEEIKFQAEEPKKKGKSPDKEEKPKGRITITEVTKFIETEKPLEEERAPREKRTVTRLTEIVEPKKDEKTVDDEKKPKDKKTVYKDKFEPEKVKELKGKSSEQDPSVKDKPFVEDKKPKDKKTFAEVTEIREPEKPKDEKEKCREKDLKPTEDDKKPKDKKAVVEEFKFHPDESMKKEKHPKDDTTKIIEPEKPKDDSTKAWKPVGKEETFRKDKKPEDRKEGDYKTTVVEVTKFIETEKPKGTEPSKKPGKPDDSTKEPKSKEKGGEEIKLEPEKHKEREEPSKKDRKPADVDKRPKVKQTVEEGIKFEVETPKEKKGKSPEQEEPSKEDIRPSEDNKKPKEKVTVIEEFKFQPGKPKEVEEPKKKGKSPEQEEPTKKDVRPAVEDKKPKDKVTVVEEIKFQAEEPKKGKSPEQEKPSKKAGKPEDDKKSKDKITTAEEIKFQPEKPKPTEEPKKKGKFPEKDSTKKEEKPKDVTAIDVSKITEPEKPTEESTKRQKSSEKEEPSRKDPKALHDEKKPKDGRTVTTTTTFEVTKFIEAERPESVQPSKKTEKPLEDITKKPKDKAIEDFTVEPGKPKEQKKEMAPEPEPSGKDGKPVDDDKKPRSKKTFAEVTEIKEPERPKELVKEKSPEKKEPSKKDDKPAEDKKPKDKKTFVEITKTTEAEKPKEQKKEKSAQEPAKKEVKSTEEDKKPTGRVTFVEEIKFQPEEPKRKEEPSKKDVAPTEDKKPKDKVTNDEEFKFQPGKPKEIEEPKEKGKSPEQEEPTKKDVRPAVEDKKPKDRVTVVEEIKFQPEEPKKKEKSPEQKEPTKKDIKSAEDKKPKEKVTVIEEFKLQAEEPKKKGKSPDKEEKPKGIITVTEVTKFIETEKPLEDERTPKDKRTVTKVTETVEPKKDEPVDDEKKPKDKKTFVEITKTTEPEKPKYDSTKTTKPVGKQEPFRKPDDDKQPKDKNVVIEEVRFEPGKPKEQKKEKTPEQKPSGKDYKPVEDDKKPKDKKSLVDIITEPEKPTEVAQKSKSADKEKPTKETKTVEVVERVEPERSVKDRKPGKEKTPEGGKPKPTVVEVETIKLIESEKLGKERTEPVGEEKAPKESKPITEIIKLREGEEPTEKDNTKPAGIKILETTMLLEHEKPREDPAKDKPKDRTTTLVQTKEFTRREGTPVEDLPGFKDGTTIQEITEFEKPLDDAQKKPKDKKPTELTKDKPSIKEPKETPKLPGDEKAKPQDKSVDVPRREQDKTKPDKPKDDRHTLIEKPKPKERTKVPEQKPKDQETSKPTEEITGQKPFDKKFSETLTFLEFEKELEKRKHPDKTVTVELEPERVAADHTVIPAVDRKSKVPEPSDKQPSKPFHEKPQKSKKDKPADEKDEQLQKIPAKDKPIFDGTRREPTAEVDEVKPTIQKMTDTRHLIEHERLPGREMPTRREKPDDEPKRKTPEKVTVIETTELIESEKTDKEPKREKTTEILTKKDQPEGTTIRQLVQPTTEPEREGKKKSPEEDKVKPLDKSKNERSDQPQKAKTPDKETKPITTPDRKPLKEVPKEEKLPEDPTKKAKLPGKEKPTDKKTSDTTELILHEKVPTKPIEDPTKKETPTDKPVKDDEPKEPSKLEEKEKPKHEKHETETVLPEETSKTKKPKDKPDDKPRPETGEEPEDIKKKKDRKKPQNGKEEPETLVGKKPEDDKAITGTEKPGDKEPTKPSKQGDQPKDTEVEFVIKHEKPGKKPTEDEERQRTQKVEVILDDRKPEDIRFREVLVGKIDKPEEPKDTFASIVGRGKGVRTSEKHIDVFITAEKSPEMGKPEDVEKDQKSIDVRFIEKGEKTMPEDTKTQKERKPKEKGTEVDEVTKKEDQQPTDGSGITGTLVSMAKSLFGFGGKKPEEQKPDETKPSEAEKKRRRRRVKKKGGEEEEEEENVEELEEPGLDIPTKPRRRRRRARKPGPKDDEEEYDDEEDEEEEDEEDEEAEEDFEVIPEDGSPEKPARRRRSKKKHTAGEEEEENEDVEKLPEAVPQKPVRKRKSKKKGQPGDEEEEEDVEQQKPGTEATLGWSVPAEEPEMPESGRTILFRYDPSDPKYQKPVDKEPQHGVMSALVEPSRKSDSKVPEKTPEDTTDEALKPSAPTFADLFTQTSPQTSPRAPDKSHKISQTKEFKTTEEGIQTETDKVDQQNQTDRRRPSKDAPDGRKTTEKSQQTSKPQTPSFQSTGTSPQIFSPEDSSAESEKPTERQQVDKKLRKPKAGDDAEESKTIDSKPVTKPGDKEDSFDVHVTAKVSVIQPDVPARSKKDKKEKKKWKDEPYEEESDDVEVSSSISLQTPRDFIETERLNIDLKPTPETEISINVKPKEKFVTEFLDSERKFTKEEPDDFEGRKGKKGKKPRSRGDAFSRKESGMPSRDSSPSSDETPGGRDGKYGIGIDIQVGDKPDVIKRKPEGEDRYKFAVDVKVKSEDSPRSPEDTGRVEIGTNFPSPRETEEQDPKHLVIYLQKSSDSGRNRVKKIQNMRNNPRSMTFMIPTYQSLPEEDIKKNVKDIEKDVANLRDAVARKDYVVVRRILVYLIKNIDDWMETVEYRIILNRQNSNEGPNREKVKELKSLKEEIGGVKQNVADLLRDVKKIPASDGDSDILYQLRTYVEQLEPQITEIQNMTETEQETEAKNLSRWEEFLNGVNNLSVLVEETRQNADRLIDSDRSTDCKLQELEQIEAANREYADRAVNLINLAKDLANEFPNQEIPPETYTTFETTKIIQNNLNNERERLLQLLSLTDEYEQTLKEFAQIVEVADNLVESPITITSLEHLQDEMQKHRKFFVNLSHCRVILESLESNLDGETRGIHNHLHGKLHAKASSILDKAASRAQQMAMAASRWTVLDKGARNEQQWLQVAHQRLPGLQQVMSSDYDQYISLYQSLASDTAVHHAKILQLMDVANKLQDVITCVGLEKFHDDYLNVILKLQEEIQSSLEKLLAFQTMWTLYEILTNKLDNWMTTAEEDLKNLKAAPGRASMRQFWELKAQYEVHNRLRQEMGDSFEKAVQFLPITDEMAQRQLLGKLEDRWKKLENEIKEIQDSATTSLSAQDVPVNEKLKLLEDELNELNDTVDDLHGVIKTDEELNLYIERIQVLSDRLDTIQEELGRLGLLPAAESEKVGYLLGLGRRLEQQLLEELEESVLLREKLLALQKGLDRVKRNQNSVSSLLDQCGVAETMGSDMVQQAVTACENISADLSDQWQDLMNLRQVLHTLPMRLRLTVSPIKVEREISQLQEVHTVLEERCRNLLNLLGNRLNMWRRFEDQLEKVQQNVQETDYMVELLTLQGSMDLDRLQTATDRLKDLRDSVSEREELVRELKRLAEPLASTCNPEVASQLNAQVDEAVTAWNGSRKNLYQIVDKYNDAVKLWKTYREARDDIRRWIDQQWHTLDLIQDKPEEAVQQIKEFKETLATQKARLDELKKLVAQIAADIGLDPGGLLECEVEDLGKRLEDVKETLTTLTSVAESRTQGKDVCKDELVKAKTFLNSVQKSLNVVGEDGNENRLSTLRDHLLALGKTESQVQNVKEKSIEMNEKPHEIKSETSVVEILELWQQVFRETFQQYYRLSSKLVRSQDGAAALQLWQEYLRHVQTFLAGSLPEDYDGLRETQRLCEVHQNLLTSQQSVLSSRQDDPAIRDFSQALQEQFNSLANLHNETLARIMDRHNEVNKRLKMWDSYRLDQSKLLSWLRDMTREQSRLQLRYIHLRRLPKLLEQIESLLSKIPQGKGLIREQQKQQEDIVKFCDEALATSIKMETVATAERINNLEASLKSWKDFLNRVKDLHWNYETELENVEKVCDEVTNELASPAPVSFSAIQSRLDLCRDLRNRISKYAKNIEEANVTYDQLKECLSPHDMKMLSQRLWLMGQRQGDLEHHLLLQILWLEDRLETQQAFNQRQARFVNWANDLIKRFDKHSPMDPTTKFMDLETRAKRLESEVEIELNLKNREYNALHAMANNIIDLSKEDAQDRDKVMRPGQNRIDYEIMKSDVERKIKEVDDAWDQLKNLKCVRVERKSKLLATMNDLWKRMEDLKLWLISIEEKLEAPSVIEKSTKKCVDKLMKDHEAIQEEIEKQSGNVGEVLNLCELFLADPAVDLTGIDTNEFESAMKALEKRWKAACLSSSERKGRILGAWELLLQLSKICKEQEKWIAEREKALQTLSSQSDSPKLNEVQKLLGQLEKEKRELDSKAPALKILDASYSKLAQESRLPAENIQQLAGPAKTLIAKWHSLYGKLKLISDKLAGINKLRDDFIRNQNSSIVLLTNISAKLMQAELLSNPKKRLKEVIKLEKELERESGCLKAADETGLELMKTCPEPQNVSATQKMIDEYQVMWKELQNRFADVKNKSLENLESKEIQVSTLAFEADSEVQVDTLSHMDRLTSRDAYGLELDVALRECGQNLKGLESILKASEGEPGTTVPTHKTLAKIIATCTSSVELVQHLNQTLLDDCGMNDIQARTAQVKEVTAKFQELVALAREREKQLREASERGRLTCPICSRRNWQQLDNDLWRLEQWILYAEAIQSNRPSLPASIEALEDVIQNHRELLIELDSHKSIIVSLNIVGDHLADHVEDEEKARSLRERLRDLNQRWDNVCSKAAEWQGKLQEALIENPEFHDTISDLVKRLENTEAVIRSSEPVDFAQDKVILESQYKKFKALSRELERYEPRVQSLQESAVQLLDRGGSAREKLNALRLRLTGLRRLIKVYLLRLGAVLGSESTEALDQTLMTLSQEMLDGTDSMSQAQTSSTAHTDGEGDTEMGNIRRGFKYLGRVFRASLPIQALMLLLLGAAALVPDEYYSCAFSNNARFQSYYPNGPPPI